MGPGFSDAVSPILKPCAARGCRKLTSGRHCAEHARLYSRQRNHRPIQAIYSSPRWRRETRPAVLARDRCCVRCGATTRLHVAHVAPTTKLLAAGADVYDTRLCVTLCSSCHGRTGSEGWPRKNRSMTSHARQPAPAGHVVTGTRPSPS